MFVDQPGGRGVKAGIEGWDGGRLVFEYEDIGWVGGWDLSRWISRETVGLAVVVWNISW